MEVSHSSIHTFIIHETRARSQSHIWSQQWFCTVKLKVKLQSLQCTTHTQSVLVLIKKTSLQRLFCSDCSSKRTDKNKKELRQQVLYSHHTHTLSLWTFLHSSSLQSDSSVFSIVSLVIRAKITGKQSCSQCVLTSKSCLCLCCVVLCNKWRQHQTMEEPQNLQNIFNLKNMLLLLYCYGNSALNFQNSVNFPSLLSSS